MISKKARAKATAAIEQRWPKGGKDTLDADIMLGSQYRQIDRNDFGSIAKGANGHKKRFAIK